MQRCCLTIARFALSAWIGAATLFVVTSIAEQRSPTIGSAEKNVLAALRFPAYYSFGFVLVGLGLVGGAFGMDCRGRRRSWLTVVGCLTLALILMVVDYVAIYSPLYAIVTDPSGVRDARFIELHRWSEQINTVDVTLCLIAALTACWSEKNCEPLTPNP